MYINFLKKLPKKSPPEIFRIYLGTLYISYNYYHDCVLLKSLQFPHILSRIITSVRINYTATGDVIRSVGRVARYAARLTRSVLYRWR